MAANYDTPDAPAEHDCAAMEEECANLQHERDVAYEERNRVVALLAALFPSGKAKTAIEGWDEEWHNCVYIDLPTGQISFHYHDDHAHLFAHVSKHHVEWDGHTTEEKYGRVALAALQLAEPF